MAGVAAATNLVLFLLFEKMCTMDKGEWKEPYHGRFQALMALNDGSILSTSHSCNNAQLHAHISHDTSSKELPPVSTDKDLS